MVVVFHDSECPTIANFALLENPFSFTLLIVPYIIAMIHDEDAPARSNGASDLVQETVHEIGRDVRQSKGDGQEVVSAFRFPLE